MEKGVLAGLTDISTITASRIVDGKSVPCEGELRYRGYDIKDLVAGFAREERFGFEEIAFLILFGRLPVEEELESFKKLLGSYRTLPTNFVRGCYHEGAEQRYDEHFTAEYPDSLQL